MARGVMTRSEKDSVATAPPPRGSPAAVRMLPWLVVIALLAAVAWLAWEAFGEEDLGDPIATSLVAFEKQNALNVFSAEFAPVVSSEDSRLFGAITSRQIAVIPARVTYTLDLSQVDANRMDWDEDTRTLSVLLPPLRIGKPNLDEARAQYLREGIWISREAQDNLTRDNTRLAERQAIRGAANPTLLNLAQAAAKTAMTQNLSVALDAAGFDDATIEVRFEGESAPPRVEGNR